MNIEDIIFDFLKKHPSIKVKDVILVTKFSRVYVNRVLKKLRDQGKIVLIGSTNRARYVLSNQISQQTEGSALSKKFRNSNLQEDQVFALFKKEFKPIAKCRKNVYQILEYAFLEMFNNAIEHSKSKTIFVEFKKEHKQYDFMIFSIIDHGIGIYNNIRRKKNLANDLEAIQDLLKGKETTDPEYHSGEGIFFTSKAADLFVIESSYKRLIIDNITDDVFIENIKHLKGTKVIFKIRVNSALRLVEIFKKYTDDFVFNKTQILIKLYKQGASHISRSQAKRILHNLDRFQVIVLDFDRIDVIGQAFADEVFRVWQSHNPNVRIDYINVHENVEFMIKRTLSSKVL